MIAQVQSEFTKIIFANDDWQKLIVSDMLDLGDNDAPCFLIKSIIIPVVINCLENISK